MSRARHCLACQPELDAMIAAAPGAQQRWQTLPRRTVAAGENLLRQGDTARHVWLIRQGLVRCYFLSPDGRERNRSFHAEGAWVGSGAPPHPSTSPYAVEALEPLQVVEMSYAELAGWLRDLPATRPVLDDGLSAAFDKQATREAELLLLDASERYLAFQKEYGDIASRIPLHHVARYLGITGVALSRIRSRMGLVAPRTRRATA